MYEIERKFLIRRPLAEILAEAGQDVRRLTIAQCYLPDTGAWAIRARKRVSDDGQAFFLTMKARHSDVTNVEIETLVPQAVYDQIAALSGHDPLTKTRHVVGRWEIDQFLNPQLDGLVVAEIELTSEDEVFERPDWLGEEVTGQAAYANAAIARRLSAVIPAKGA